MSLSGNLILKKKIFNPAFSRTIHQSTNLSYGAQQSTYDVRVSFDADGLISYMMVYPGMFFLCSTIEHVSMPWNYSAVVHDKSTWIRRGLTVGNSLIDAGFRGYVTLELKYHGDKIFRLDYGTPIAQFQFHKIEGASKNDIYQGKYQDQESGPQEAR